MFICCVVFVPCWFVVVLIGFVLVQLLLCSAFVLYRCCFVFALRRFCTVQVLPC